MNVVFLLISCTKEYGWENTCDAISFSSSITSLKSSFNEDFAPIWQKEDMVGIFAQVAGSSIGENVPYYAKVKDSDSRFASFIPSGEELKWKGKGTYEFYAYSPYMMKDCTPDKVPFSLPAVQRGDLEGLSTYSLVAARKTVKTDDTSQRVDVDFTFSHLFCFIHFKLTPGEDLRGRKLVKAYLSSNSLALAGMKGTVDLTSDPVRVDKTDSGLGTIIIEPADQTLIYQNPVELYLVCFPSGNGDLKLTLTFDDGSAQSFDYENVTLQPNAALNLSVRSGSSVENVASTEFPSCMSFASQAARPLYAAVSENLIHFADGATLQRENGEHLDFTASSTNPSVSSRNWTEDSYYLITLPLKEAYNGLLRMDFKLMSRGFANWRADWSADGLLWHFGQEMKLDISTQAQLCTQYFEIPQNETIPAGGDLYIRIKPVDMQPCQFGGLPYVDENTDPRLCHAIVLTSCNPVSTPQPAGSLLFEPFDDCTEGVDAVRFGPEKLYDVILSDGPEYTSAVKAWQRPGYLRLGEKSYDAQYTTAPVQTDGNVKVELDLAAFYTKSGAYDIGRITVGVVSPSGVEQTSTLSTTQLKDGRWHKCQFEFSGVSAGSSVFVRSSSTRFYLDNLTLWSI